MTYSQHIATREPDIEGQKGNRGTAIGGRRIDGLQQKKIVTGAGSNAGHHLSPTGCYHRIAGFVDNGKVCSGFNSIEQLENTAHFFIFLL